MSHGVYFFYFRSSSRRVCQLFFKHSIFLSIFSLVLGLFGLRYEWRSKESTDKVCVWELAFKRALHDRQQNGLPSAGDLGRSPETSVRTAITIQKKLSNQRLRTSPSFSLAREISPSISYVLCKVLARACCLPAVVRARPCHNSSGMSIVFPYLCSRSME